MNVNPYQKNNYINLSLWKSDLFYLIYIISIIDDFFRYGLMI